MRDYCSRWTAAEATLAVAWAAFATGPLADALVRDSVGSAVASPPSRRGSSATCGPVHARQPLTPHNGRARGSSRHRGYEAALAFDHSALWTRLAAW